MTSRNVNRRRLVGGTAALPLVSGTYRSPAHEIGDHICVQAILP